MELGKLSNEEKIRPKKDEERKRKRQEKRK